jgi:hypothetical protein
MFLKLAENGWSCVRCASPLTSLSLHRIELSDEDHRRFSHSRHSVATNCVGPVLQHTRATPNHFSHVHYSGARRRYVTTPYCQFEVQGKPSHSSATTWRRALRNDETELDHKHVAVSASVPTDFRCVGKPWADWWALNKVQLRCSILTPSQNYEGRLLTSSRLSVCLSAWNNLVPTKRIFIDFSRKKCKLQ